MYILMDDNNNNNIMAFIVGRYTAHTHTHITYYYKTSSDHNGVSRVQ